MAAQSFTPRTIQFEGAPGLPAADLLAASQLTPGQPITMDQVRMHAQILIDSGLFDDLHYNFTGQALVLQLTPSTQVFPMRLLNFPFGASPELDAKLHAQFPLYHGRVPADGALLSGVRRALEQMLATQGLEATVKAVPFTDPKAMAITSMDFSIYIPDVVIGAIHVDAPATTDAVAGATHDVTTSLTGTAYDHAGSAAQIESGLLTAYRDRGYLDCAVHPVQQLPVEVAVDQVARAIRIPFNVTVEPGALYHLSSLALAPGAAVSQADFDRASNVHPGDPADVTRLRQTLDFIARQYRDSGHVRATATLAPTVDRGQKTVAYTVNVDPGPVYTMGQLAIENVTGTLRGEMLAAWKMAPGAVFNESAIMDYFTDRKLPADLKRTFATVNVHYTLHINDAAKTVDVEVILQNKKPPQ